MAAMQSAQDENVQFSDYFAGLDGPSKLRYREKVSICGFDPYSLKKSDYSENVELLPIVQYPDIVNYLVLQTSWATKSQMKAYKSMDAYNFFVSGWVNTLCMRCVGTDKVVVFARVSEDELIKLLILTFSLHVIPSFVSDRFSFMCTTTFR